MAERAHDLYTHFENVTIFKPQESHVPAGQRLGDEVIAGRRVQSSETNRSQIRGVYDPHYRTWDNWGRLSEFPSLQMAERVFLDRFGF